MNSIGLVVASSADPTVMTIVDTDSDDDPDESEAEPITSSASAKPSSKFAKTAGAASVAERSRRIGLKHRGDFDKAWLTTYNWVSIDESGKYHYSFYLIFTLSLSLLGYRNIPYILHTSVQMSLSKQIVGLLNCIHIFFNSLS